MNTFFWDILYLLYLSEIDIFWDILKYWLYRPKYIFHRPLEMDWTISAFFWDILKYRLYRHTDFFLHCWCRLDNTYFLRRHENTDCIVPNTYCTVGWTIRYFFSETSYKYRWYNRHRTLCPFFWDILKTHIKTITAVQIFRKVCFLS